MNLNAILGMTHQVLDVIYRFHLFVARLNRLAAVVMLEPVREIGLGWCIAIQDQDAVFGLVADLETFQPDPQRIGTFFHPVV